MERIPPQDLDAEMALVGSMLMSREAVAVVVPIIPRSESRWLYIPAHRTLYELILDLYGDPTKVIDMIVVSDELRKREALEAVGGHDYMIDLAESFADVANAEYYARIVRDKGMLRDLIRCCGEIEKAAYGHEEPTDILSEAESKMLAVTQQRIACGSRALLPLGDLIETVPNTLFSPHRVKLRTRLFALDPGLGRLRTGELVILAAEQGKGKTALAMEIGIATAMAGTPAMLFSVEMNRDQVAIRCAAILGQHSTTEIESGEESTVREMISLIDREYGKAPLYVVFRVNRTEDICAMTRAEVARRGVRLVFVDFAQLLRTRGRFENKHLEFTEMLQQFKELALQNDICVVLLSQINREGKKNPRPQMRDARGSGSFEEFADQFWLLYSADAAGDTRHRNVETWMRLEVAKHKNGPKGVIRMRLMLPTMTFSCGQEPVHLWKATSTAPASEIGDSSPVGAEAEQEAPY